MPKLNFPSFLSLIRKAAKNCSMSKKKWTDKEILCLLKSDNLQYNTLVRWADGTKDLSTKHLTFQVFFFHNFL